MTLIITSNTNRKFAETIAKKHDQVEFASPTQRSVNYGASKVIVIGSYPALEKRYQGIVPVEVIDPKPRPRKEVIHVTND